jgi:hypothetical protein
MNTIKPLEKQFTGIGEVKGYKFTQIRVTNYGFLYEVNTGNGKYYEVFKKRINKRFANVSYPKAKSFGKWAWTTHDLSKAIKILKSFENEHD